MEPSPNQPAGLTVERVEWLPSGGGTGLVRVRGRWPAEARQGAALPELLAGGTRHASLPDPRAAREPDVWRGAYIVGAEHLDGGKPLELAFQSGARVVLPAPEQGVAAAPAAAAVAEPAPADPGGEVIDRAVMAERRARRAEAAEQAQARIAAEALKAVEILELRGAELEERLEALTAERDGLAGGESVEMLRERLAAAETRAVALRHEAAEARAEGERVARQAVEAAEDERAHQAGALAEARAAAIALRAMVEGWRARWEGAELARANLQVRLAVLTAREREGRPAAAAAAEAEPAPLVPDPATEALRQELAAAREARVALEAELAEVREALAAARREAEGSAGEVAGLREELDALEEAREAARAMEGERDRALADVEALRTLAAAAEETNAVLSAELEAARRTAPAAPPEAALTPPDSPVRRPVLAGDAAGLGERARALATPAAARPVPHGLLGDLDAAAAALRARVPIASPPAPPARGHATGAARREYPWLRGALVKLAHDDRAVAARLLAGLLPAQADILGPGVSLDYDLTISELGTFAVTVAGGTATIHPLPVPRPRGEAGFRLTGTALGYAELLAGHGRRPRWIGGPVRLTGRDRRSAEPLLALPGSVPSLARAVACGARLDPSDVLRAYPYVVHPSWTRGHAFTVVQEVDGSGAWAVTARDGGPLTVSRAARTGPAPDATVTLSRPAFDALLRRETAPRGQRPRVRGDRAAVALLKAWTDRALGDPAPDPPAAD